MKHIYLLTFGWIFILKIYIFISYIIQLWNLEIWAKIFPFKGCFLSESAICFNLQISKKKIPNHYPELEIWICCLLLLAGNLNFNFRIVIWNIFLEIWRFEKHTALSEKSHHKLCLHGGLVRKRPKVCDNNIWMNLIQIYR